MTPSRRPTRLGVEASSGRKILAEKVKGCWVVQNASDDFLGDTKAGVFTFFSEGMARTAAQNAGPSFSVRRIRLNTGDVR